MSLDELAHLWNQSEPEDKAAKSRLELQETLAARIKTAAKAVSINNQEIVLYFVISSVLVTGLWFLQLDATNSPDKSAILLEIIFIQLFVLLGMFLMKSRWKISPNSENLERSLQDMKHQLKTRMQIELMIVGIALPMVLLITSLLNQPYLVLTTGLGLKGMLLIYMQNYVIIGGIIWSGYKRPLDELKKCQLSWEELRQ